MTLKTQRHLPPGPEFNWTVDPHQTLDTVRMVTILLIVILIWGAIMFEAFLVISRGIS